MQQKVSQFPEFYASAYIIMCLSLPAVPSVFLSPIVLRDEAALFPFARERCLLYQPSVGTHPPAWQQERKREPMPTLGKGELSGLQASGKGLSILT